MEIAYQRGVALAQTLSVNAPDMQLTEHFYGREFECHGENCCGHRFFVSPVLLEVVEKIRKRCCEVAGRDVPLTISSGYRCWAHNVELYVNRGQKPSNSKHCLGLAADIYVPEAFANNPREFASICEDVVAGVRGGFNYYPRSRFCHVDVEPFPPNRRW